MILKNRNFINKEDLTDLVTKSALKTSTTHTISYTINL